MKQDTQKNKRSNQPFTIRIASRKEVDIAIEWAAIEGWNPGLHDATSYYAADSSGFLIGYLGNEPIATISAIKYGKSFGFIGFYIVKPSHRDKGYGIQIWNAALDNLKGRNVGLDGVITQQKNYQKSNFKLAYRNIRYASIVGDNAPIDKSIIKLSDIPFNIIESYDRPFFPDIRSTLIQSWINQPDCNAFGMMNNRKLVGYGVIRRCRNGHKIGPLFANSQEIARSLFLSLQSSVNPTDQIFLDIPALNQAAISLAKTYKMEAVFETARMYIGETPDLPLQRTFGVTSFEVG